MMRPELSTDNANANNDTAKQHMTDIPGLHGLFMLNEPKSGFIQILNIIYIR